ncbi:MAG: hypothetical protein ACRC6I_18235 [Paracoccaceae bacterium]
MTDEERRIAREAAETARKEAELEHRVETLEEKLKSFSDRLKWLFGAMWAGVAYLAIRFFDTLGGPR